MPPLCYVLPLSFQELDNHGGGSPSRGLSVHGHSRRNRPPAQPRGPQADLSVWTSFLEEEVHQIQGFQTLASICTVFPLLKFQRVRVVVDTSCMFPWSLRLVKHFPTDCLAEFLEKFCKAGRVNRGPVGQVRKSERVSDLLGRSRIKARLHVWAPSPEPPLHLVGKGLFFSCVKPQRV